MNIRRIIICLMIPGGLVLPLSVALWQWSPRPHLLETFLPFWPYVVFGFGVLLGWRFQRSRLLLTLLLLAVSQKKLLGLLPDGLAELTLAAMPLLLPLNLLWLAFASERHLLSISTAMRLLFLGGQAVLIGVAHHYVAEQSWDVLRATPLAWPMLDQLPLLKLGQLAAFSFVLTALCFIAVLVWRPTMERGAQLWMLLSVLLAQLTHGAQAQFYMATAALILIVTLLETSHSMAFRDELTGLGSRRALNEYLQRLGGTYTLAMVDIDHFKKVNDTHGHDIGDQVLKMVATCLVRVKGGGRAFRYGGEEFTLVFPGKEAAVALPHLEALRVAIANAAFALRGKSRPKQKPKKVIAGRANQRTLKVTVSMGVAEHCGRKQTAEQVVKRADQALYRAKHSGRNRIC